MHGMDSDVGSIYIYIYIYVCVCRQEVKVLISLYLD